MMLRVLEKIKERFRQMPNLKALQAMDMETLMPFLIILAITMLSFEATDLFYKILRFPLSQQTAAMKSASSLQAPDGARQRQLRDYTVISDRNLFASTLKAVSDSEPAEGLVDSGPKITDFDLKGTVACHPSCGFIVVEERGSRKQKLYRIGDKVGPHQLVKITRNAATLKSGEREVTIRIKETIDGPLLPNAPSSRTRPASAAMPVFSKDLARGDSDHFQQLMGQAIVRPFVNKGVREGYIVSNIAPSSLYEIVGLQNGDIILDINGNQMQNANDLMQLLESMQSGGHMDLNIRRQGKAETINFVLE